MQLIENRNMCCGCGVCAQICGRKAIKMSPDEEGFLYPVIDDGLCVNCGLCKINCAFQNHKKLKSGKKGSSYAVKHKEDDVRSGSQSGGAFSALTDSVLVNYGVVYGATINTDFCAEHMRATSKELRDAQRGSKYIQSSICEVLPELRKDAEAGNNVIFSGTPCQIASVHQFLNSYDQRNIFYIDILCYGVPSPLVWKKYISWQESKKMKKITGVVFRDKNAFGWHSCWETFYFEDGKESSQIFKKLFFNNCTLRPSCYNCPYTTLERVSDITIGDCWGIDKVNPSFDDNKGVSMVMVNTEKGKQLFEKAKWSLTYEIIDIANYMQRPLQKSVICPKNRDKFWKDFRNKRFDYIVKKYSSDTGQKIKQIFRMVKKLALHTK